MSDRLGMPPSLHDAGQLKKTAAGYVRALHLIEVQKSGGKIPPALRVWFDHRGAAVDIAKAAVGDIGIDDFGAAGAVSDSVMEMARETGILPQLIGTREVPFHTAYYVQTSAVTAAEVAQSKPIPVFRGAWTKKSNSPRKFAGVAVITNEALESPSLKLAQAVTADAAKACAEAQNAAFVGDVFGGSPSFATSDPDADLRRLCDLMPSGPDLSWIMCRQTATHLSLIGSGGGGAARFPSITPEGGQLLGRQVLISQACDTGASPVSRMLGLVAARRVFWTPGSATVERSTQAGLEMSDAPTGATDTPTAASQYLVSMYQAEAAAIKVFIESDWYAADDAAVYTLVDY